MTLNYYSKQEENMKNRKNYRPLRPAFGWVGGKTQLSGDIVALMPPHNMYIEVFAGGLSVLFKKDPNPDHGLLNFQTNPKNTREKNRKSEYTEIINDTNSDLINLYKVIRNHRQRFIAYLHNFYCSRQGFQEAMMALHYNKHKNRIHRAALYYYTLVFSFGSKGDSFAMPKGRRVKNIWKDFKAHSNRLQRVCIENLDFRRLIKEYDKPFSFFYADPPYVGTEDYYKNIKGFGMQEHQDLCNLLSNIKGKFLVSYNDCDTVRELYKDFNIRETKKVRYSLNNSDNTKRKGELFITNY